MLMLSVLIVDDERAICYLIRKLIHWEELGLIYAGSASDGWEAWSMAQKKRPDIIITDIQMPKMNGMELIERFREEKIPTDFVIVSGYQEFEYAKQAIRFGVEDYLLKPIKEAELNRILKRICEKSQENLEIASAEAGTAEKKESCPGADSSRRTGRSGRGGGFSFSWGSFFTGAVSVLLFRRGKRRCRGRNCCWNDCGTAM